ncbi:hypothetical protein ACJRO7_008879 [Eucalyptus globulus]|uniref:Secreted protein n=1 Tax=Eucalyptus globulus TaxID=34317 RepID=A0ABD3IT95_EUCGL
MKKILSSKVATGLMVLLFLMGTSMRSSEACRLLEGHEGAQDGNREPSLLVLQSLQKGPPPCTGNCSGKTPGSSTTTASTTGTKAFTGRLLVGVPRRGYSGHVSQYGVTADHK